MSDWLAGQTVPLLWFIGGLALLFSLAGLGMCALLHVTYQPCRRPHRDEPPRIHTSSRGGPRTQAIRHPKSPRLLGETRVLTDALTDRGVSFDE